MRNTKTILLIIFFFQITSFVFGQDAKIEIPNFDDKYSNYVKELKGGNLDIDYADFRNSFLESKQFSKKGTNYDSLKRKVIDEIKHKNYKGVLALTKAMLDIDYTSMFAHMYLQKTYAILGDTLNSNKYHDIKSGLINSIIQSGDGITCETGWHVTQIEEEYFIIYVVLGAEFESQSTSSGGNNNCDKMVVKQEGETKTYFFEANKVFEMEKKMFE